MPVVIWWLAAGALALAFWFGYASVAVPALLLLLVWQLLPVIRDHAAPLFAGGKGAETIPLIHYRQALSQCAPTLSDHRMLRHIPAPPLSTPPGPAGAREFFYFCQTGRFGSAERIVGLFDRRGRLIGALTEPKPVEVARAALSYNADRIISVHCRPEGTTASDVLYAARLYGFCQLLDLDYGGDWLCWEGEQIEHFVRALGQIQSQTG